MKSGFGLVKSHRPSISPSFSFCDKNSLTELDAEKLWSWNGGKPKFRNLRYKLSSAGKSLSEMILEDRG